MNLDIESKTQIQEKRCTVYFDCACPLCSKEIATYKQWRGAESILWIDASACPEYELGSELKRDTALARLHVRNADGELEQGAAAFIELWTHFPAMAWFTPCLSQPMTIKLLDTLYRLFLKIRPLWRKPPPKNTSVCPTHPLPPTES
ncbi:thiol-disulfide oxidoreductase DCC family protein [Undibacterium sp. Ren11W]|uniref:thiol-disulfide oxidoreductase DCC family protein n=1 Tax=Undibacterium sp. Ren11W TaxID=3413045 RepID=UPI003BF20C61